MINKMKNNFDKFQNKTILQVKIANVIRST
jgi:hypothetical protein